MSNNIHDELNNSSSMMLLRDPNTDPTNLEILLHLHSKGEWLQPGGKREPGEHSVQTAMREVQEETGFTPDQYRFLSTTKTPLMPSELIVPLPTPIATFILYDQCLIDDMYAAILRPEHAFCEPNNSTMNYAGFEWFNLERLNELGNEIPSNVAAISRWLLTDACTTAIDSPKF